MVEYLDSEFLVELVRRIPRILRRWNSDKVRLGIRSNIRIQCRSSRFRRINRSSAAILHRYPRSLESVNAGVVSFRGAGYRGLGTGLGLIRELDRIIGIRTERRISIAILTRDPQLLDVAVLPRLGGRPAGIRGARRGRSRSRGRNRREKRSNQRSRSGTGDQTG